MDWSEYVVADPAICHGQTCLKGTRVPVSVVLDNLATGYSPEEILESYPALSRESIRSAIACAADLTRAWIVTMPWDVASEVQ